MEIAELNRWLAERNLGGHWLQEHGPEKWKPYLWKWSEVYEALCRAGEAVPIDKSGRRTIQLKNPSLERGMTHTIHISVQLVKPGRSRALTATLPQRSAMSLKVRTKRSLLLKVSDSLCKREIS